MKFPLQALLSVCLLLIGLTACRGHFNSYAHREQYGDLTLDLNHSAKMQPSDYFLVLLVDARHLDYSDIASLLKTIVKHPSDGSKNGDVGHAWIYLQGKIDGVPVHLEGGHSGELGCQQAKYFDGIMNYLDFGYANPNKNQRLHLRYEPNPVKYLWETQRDGFFQPGSGSHIPTFAAKINLSLEQFEAILAFVQEYNYKEYAITENQCSSYIASIAALGGLTLDHLITIQIPPGIQIGSERVRLWEDPRYALLTFSSPDLIELSLRRAVYEGCVENAQEWALGRYEHPWSLRMKNFYQGIIRFPERLQRCLYLRRVKGQRTKGT